MTTADEERAAAYRASMARRLDYRAAVNARLAGSEPARQAVQAAFDPLRPPYEIEVPDAEDEPVTDDVVAN